MKTMNKRAILYNRKAKKLELLNNKIYSIKFQYFITETIFVKTVDVKRIWKFPPNKKV